MQNFVYVYFEKLEIVGSQCNFLCRTAEEIRNGELLWPFWTKLVVVAIGFTGGLVFMYIQCKVYVHLCRKWKAYNRTIVVQVSCIHIFFLFITLAGVLETGGRGATASPLLLKFHPNCFKINVFC